MTVKNSPRRVIDTSVALPEIPEEQDGSLSSSVPDVRPRSATPPHPTEYHQSFRTRGGPRPRNPLGGWQARNLSNILPSGPERPPQPSRAGRRPPPEALLARQAQSQIFPIADPPPPPNARTRNDSDVNNNPNAPPPIVAGGRRRTGRWPWQARAQRSSIFLGESENVPPPVTRPHIRYPWQERAQRSVIFEVLTGQDTGPKKKACRTYDWDQRQSKLVTEAVQQKPSEEGAKSKDKVESKKGSSMPWKERAMQSVVFRSPDKPPCPRPVNFVWDQRRTRFSVQPDPTAQFSKGSSYKDNYVKWQGVEEGKSVMKAAGKPCYTFDDVKEEKQTTTISPGGGKRRFKKGEGSPGKGEILALPAPPPQSKSTKSSPNSSSSSAIGLKSVKGATCLDIVPVGYAFSNRKLSSGSDTRRKSGD